MVTEMISAEAARQLINNTVDVRQILSRDITREARHGRSRCVVSYLLSEEIVSELIDNGFYVSVTNAGDDTYIYWSLE